MKRSLLISGLLATVVTVFGLSGTSSCELDLPGLNQRIDNIDARTTNNEADIQALKQSTGAAPAEHVPVPAAPVVQSAPAPTAAPASIAPQPVVAEPTPAPVAAPATPAPTPTACIVPVVSNAPGTSIEVIGGCR